MMFKITGGSGFHITFENGWTVSVQFGPGTYADNYNMGFANDGAVKAGAKGSKTAECAVWGPDNLMLKYRGWGDTVSNRSTPAEVLRLLKWAARQKSEEEK